MRVVHDSPRVMLLDAREEGLDSAGLRERARALCDESGAAHTVRSYRDPYALVAFHDEPVGVDIEHIEPCDERFARLICTPEELGEGDSDEHLTSLWCSKEALSKALGDALDYDPSRLGSPMSWPDLAAGPWRAAQLELVPEHTGWLCWRAA